MKILAKIIELLSLFVFIITLIIGALGLYGILFSHGFSSQGENAGWGALFLSVDGVIFVVSGLVLFAFYSVVKNLEKNNQ